MRELRSLCTILFVVVIVRSPLIIPDFAHLVVSNINTHFHVCQYLLAHFPAYFLHIIRVRLRALHPRHHLLRPVDHRRIYPDCRLGAVLIALSVIPSYTHHRKKSICKSDCQLLKNDSNHILS